MLYELGLAMHGEDPDVYVMRFLRARKWVPEDAVNMLVNMLRWRASFGVRQILLEAEGPLHKSEMKRCQSYFCGTDKEGRICCFVHANRHNTSDLVRNLSEKLIVLTMESACMILQQPEFKSTTATMLVDLRDAGIQHQDSIATRFMLNVMQNYYPERLGRALIISAPWIFSGFWQLIKPWLDPVVQAKVVFVSREEVSQYVDISQTVKHLGGEMRDFVYTDAPESELNGITKLRSEMSQTERDDIWASFKQGLDEYVATTLAWCKGTDGVDNGARLIAAKRIQSDYVRLTPIVRAPTNYHRMGIHRDEAFKSIVTLV
ncbi:hypothetical protein QVD99_002505 [Batrachochytrium dendrobatidis]|nr:hypothetical protein O5D80_006733 [Batrachochytrium dendrobatidis]KAK5670730.1 hypothetical protein QVD99_002505 [Batrachochytrium dendrobatidis]OAJ40600.1 hypothetical protein, variant [Batrachochytrium dendrobatidis JEL423]